MRTKVLPTHTSALFNAAVAQATVRLGAGELVALPTETVYGLAANALDPRAVATLYETKGRPAHNPIIVHIVGLDMARRCVANWPPEAHLLAHAFWPGPLTLVLPRAKAVPEIVAAGGLTVGVRWPSHPLIQAVIRACGFPLAAPSANLSARISPTNAAHVLKALGGRIPLIVDGGQCQVGIESTVVDLTARPLRVLRPGMIHEESLRAVVEEFGVRSSEFEARSSEFGVRSSEFGHRSSVIGHWPSRTGDRGPGTGREDQRRADGPPLRSPGLLQRHYAPRAKLVVLEWHGDAWLNAQLSTLNAQRSTTHVIAHTQIPSGDCAGQVSVIPHDPEAFARAIYAELHRCDEAGARLIVVEAPPDRPEWRAIADRLRRAAA
jgi:L-threonylcarbamoyladenylate synthase